MFARARIASLSSAVLLLAVCAAQAQMQASCTFKLIPMFPSSSIPDNRRVHNCALSVLLPWCRSVISPSGDVAGMAFDGQSTFSRLSALRPQLANRPQSCGGAIPFSMLQNGSVLFCVQKLWA